MSPVNQNSPLEIPKSRNILEKISLGIVNGENLGLGTMNRLYMATELLHLKKEWDGLKLCIIEELEAHLHPQAQMKIIDALRTDAKDIQMILTSHSPNLASKVPLENIILCKDSDAYPLSHSNTALSPENYQYLERFLDVTKSNLFFAKGVIIVEGWSEEIIIPVLAKLSNCDLTKMEVSLVNVGSTAFLHFAKIFVRTDGRKLNVPVSIISDLDNRPDEYGIFRNDENKSRAIESLKSSFSQTSVKAFYAEEWTLEWCLYKSPSLSTHFRASVAKVHSGTEEFINGIFEENKFVKKLRKDKGTAPLDKVKIATVLAGMLEESPPTLQSDDKYIKYIIDAIKYACNANR
ncbi:ATP-dependent nuclease [Dyadobacter fanqingshengii]|uniref:AAA family ATPase n=1 Tax=Dyadobacter fanqingshengii TaxID=2906443 RepID=A0A9X1P8J0_9BACT|nr:TOPRIM nucleotidyl transferase/hydrolase domain-containing protein [Dyadobacter fanqingshengii]MCF0038697.1 AAA family ATPase [Dyadobacter fanqingshengii]USJ34470.1 AAA family ATPase [Dyadobacter fanqingshengii]